MVSCKSGFGGFAVISKIVGSGQWKISWSAKSQWKWIWNHPGVGYPTDVLVSCMLLYHNHSHVNRRQYLFMAFNCSRQKETSPFSEIGARKVPWNSMELLVSAKLVHIKFHGIPWNSMELLVSAKLAHPKFYGIPWNFSCQRNGRTSSSMEFHGTSRVSEIGAL